MSIRTDKIENRFIRSLAILILLIVTLPFYVVGALFELLRTIISEVGYEFKKMWSKK